MPEFYIKDKKGNFYDLAYIEIKTPVIDALFHIKENYPGLVSKYASFFRLLDINTFCYELSPFPVFYYIDKVVKEKIVYEDPDNNFKNLINHQEFLRLCNNQKMWNDFNSCADQDLYIKEYENKIKNKKLITSRMRQLDSIISDNKIVKKIRTDQCYFGPKTPHLKEISEYIDLVDLEKRNSSISLNSQIYLLNIIPPDLIDLNKVGLIPNTSIDKYVAGSGYLVFLKDNKPADQVSGFYVGGKFIIDYSALALGEISDAKVFSSRNEAVRVAKGLSKTAGLINCQYYVLSAQIKVGDLVSSNAPPSGEVSEILNYQTSVAINKNVKKSAIKKKVINKL